MPLAAVWHFDFVQEELMYPEDCLLLLHLLPWACIGVYFGLSSFALRLVQLSLVVGITAWLAKIFPILPRLCKPLRDVEAFLHQGFDPRKRGNTDFLLEIQVQVSLLLLLPCVSLGLELVARSWVDVAAGLTILLDFVGAPPTLRDISVAPFVILQCCAMAFNIYAGPALLKLCQGVEKTGLVDLIDRSCEYLEREYDRRLSEQVHKPLILLVLRVLACLLVCFSVAWISTGVALFSVVWLGSTTFITMAIATIDAPAKALKVSMLPIGICVICGFALSIYVEPALLKWWQGATSFAETTSLVTYLGKLTESFGQEYARRRSEFVQIPLAVLVILRVLVCLLVTWTFPGFALLVAVWYVWCFVFLVLRVSTVPASVREIFILVSFMCRSMYGTYVEPALFQLCQGVTSFTMATLVISTKLLRDLNCFVERECDRQQEELVQVPFVSLLALRALVCLSVVWILLGSGFVSVCWFAVAAALFLGVRSIDANVAAFPQTILLLCAGKFILFAKLTLSRWLPAIQRFTQETMWRLARDLKCFFMRKYVRQPEKEQELRDSCARGDLVTVRSLVEEAYVNLDASSDGRTPLLLATQNGHSEVVEFLLEQRAEVNVKNRKGLTALMLAAQGGHERIVELLITKRADVNARDSEENTPLILASQHGHSDVVEFLLEQRAEVNEKNGTGSTALTLAAQKGHQRIIELLISKGAEVDPQDNKGKTPLMEAALRGDLATVKLLLNLGADPSMTDAGNSEARHLASRKGHINVYNEILRSKLHYQPRTVSPRSALQTPIHATEIEFGDFDLVKNVGGDFAGLWLDSEVAITVFGNSSGITLPFEEQVKSWLGLRHPNIQNLYGAVNEGYYLFVCEHMTGGSLYAYVYRPDEEWREGDVEYAFDCLYDSALGLRFLHERGIVHGAVLLDNILISADKKAKLANMKWATDKGELDDIRALAKCIQQVCRRVRSLTSYPPIISRYEKLATDISSSLYTISFVVYSLESIWSQRSATQSDRDRKVSDLNYMLSELHKSVKDSENELYIELCGDLETMYENLLGGKTSISGQVYDGVADVLQSLQHAMYYQGDRSHNIQRLSSSRAADVSLDFFLGQMENLLNILGASKVERETFEQRKKELRGSKAEVFVSVVEQKLTLLAPTETNVVLTLLQKELQSGGYTAEQCAIIERACESLESGQLSNSLEPRPEWFIDWHGIENEKEFATGGFGKVSRAKWLNSDVVVKRLLMADDRGEVRQRFQDEMSLWFDLNHPHVVKLFGGCHIGPPFFVCEWAENGRLDKYLDKHPPELWQKLYQAALGLEYLHARNIRHGDLKCDNILISSDGRAQLTDFGLSSSESIVQDVMTAATRWKAPECFETKKTSCESDVFSLGMCIIEAVTGDLPWGRKANDLVVKRNVLNKQLPPRPEKMTDSQWNLVEDMCRFDPSKRLNILVVVQRLKQLAENPDVDLIERAVVKGPDSFVAALLELMQYTLSAMPKEKANPVEDAGYQIYSLLVDRLRDVIANHDDVKFDSRLTSIVETVNNWVKQQKDQQPEQEQSTVDLLKTMFHGFSLHRQIDLLLMQVSVETSNEAHRWSEKWSEYIRCAGTDTDVFSET